MNGPAPTQLTDYIGAVRQFNLKYGHYISDKPFDGDKYPMFPTKVVKLRERLITEEAHEFKDWSYENYDTFDTIPIDIINIADAIGDLLYVSFGAAIAYNIPIDKVFEEIHRSNMTKEGTDEHGKTIKGENYSPPNIRQVLERYMK